MKEVFHNCGKPPSDNDLENIIERGLQSVELHNFNKAGPELKSSSIFKNSLKISSLLLDSEEFNLN